MSSIYDFEDDIIRSKLGGLWLEFLVLATLLGIAVIMMLVSWQVKISDKDTSFDKYDCSPAMFRCRHTISMAV